MSEPYIAEVQIWANNFVPRGWSYCNGQLLQIAQNSALFSLIGTIYGGDGRTTTGLPNLSNSSADVPRAAMHPGRGPGLTSRSLGQTTGVHRVTLTESQLPNHTHTARAYSAKGTSETGDSSRLFGNRKEQNVSGASQRLNNYAASGANNVNMAAEALSNAGGGSAHENRQPYLAVNFCIALTGLYPSRS